VSATIGAIFDGWMFWRKYGVFDYVLKGEMTLIEYLSIEFLWSVVTALVLMVTTGAAQLLISAYNFRTFR
jgi:hypothetical protein